MTKHIIHLVGGPEEAIERFEIEQPDDETLPSIMQWGTRFYRRRSAEAGDYYLAKLGKIEIGGLLAQQYPPKVLVPKPDAQKGARLLQLLKMIYEETSDAGIVAGNSTIQRLTEEALHLVAPEEFPHG